MQINMLDCEKTMLGEISNDEITKRDVAQSYRLAMESTEITTINWGIVNRAIMDRWGKDGLIEIKRTAHSGECFSDTK